MDPEIPQPGPGPEPAAPALFHWHLQYCQKIPKIDSRFLHIELLSREAWTSKDTRFLTPSLFMYNSGDFYALLQSQS